MRIPIGQAAQFLLSLALALGCMGMLLPSRANALDPDKPVESYLYTLWSKKNGLPQAAAFVAKQTSDRYVWVGTHEGLARFNGQTFEYFHPNDYPGLGGRFVYDFAEAKDGSLWIATSNGLSHFDGKEAQLFGKEDGLPFSTIESVCIDVNDNIWMASPTYQVASYKNGVVTRVTVDAKRNDVDFNKVYCSRTGDVWIASSNGLYRRHPNGDIESVPIQTEHLSRVILTLTEDDQGVLWVGTAGGVGRWQDGSVQPVPELKDAQRFQINSLLIDRNRSVWIGTKIHGGFVYKNGRLESAFSKMHSAPEISSIFEDVEGNVWIGTQHVGLFKLSDPKLTTLAPFRTPKLNITWSVLVDSAQNLWMVTVSGIAAYRPDGTRIPLNNDLENATPSVLYQGRNGIVLVGTDRNGLFRYKDGIMRQAPGMEALKALKIRSLLEGDDGTLWVGTREQGLFGLKNGKVAEHLGVQNGLPDSRVTSLSQMQRGVILITTNAGWIAHKDGALFQPFTGSDAPSTWIYPPYYDYQGNVWFPTMEDGLYLARNNRTFHFTMENGLPDNSSFALQEDDQGFLWASNNNGLFKISKADLLDIADGKMKETKAETFGKEAGMLSAECNAGSDNPAARTRDGRILFSCTDGAVMINTRKIAMNDVPPRVVIENALVDGQALSNNAVTPRGAKRYEFHFASLSFVQPSRAKYSYKLEGYDDEWIDISETKIAFSELKPGSYAFKVRATNNDGVWSTEEASLAFSHAAAFWETLWFWLTLGVIVAALIWFFVRRQIVGERKRTRELSELSWQRTKTVLDSQVGVIQELVSNAASVTGNIQDLMNQLSDSSDKVVSAATETAATVEELGRTGKAAETSAKRIVEASAKTSAESVKGVASVDRSVGSMAEIKERSGQVTAKSRDLLQYVAEVDRIAQLVGEMSDQSSVLAVNAAIEASKAGEYGAGFIVVSDNMQDLARQSKSASDEILSILRTIGYSIGEISKTVKRGETTIENGVQDIQSSGRIVRTLRDEVSENANLAGVIAKTIEQQMTGLSYIGDAIQSFTSSVEENNMISVQVSGAVEQLNGSIDRLLENMAQWETPEFYFDKSISNKAQEL